MTTLKRRALLGASMATLAAPQIMAQSKPEKLVYVGDNGPWHWVMVEEVAPAFEKATGIKIDFTLLPVDPWRARLRATSCRTETGSGPGTRLDTRRGQSGPWRSMPRATRFT